MRSSCPAASACRRRLQSCRLDFDEPIEKGQTMGWASDHIMRLQNGATVQFRPRGHSMRGKIESGQLCTVEPVDTSTLKVDDIVLCKVNGRQYLHLVKAVQGARFLIGNN